MTPNGRCIACHQPVVELSAEDGDGVYIIDPEPDNTWGTAWVSRHEIGEQPLLTATDLPVNVPRQIPIRYTLHRMTCPTRQERNPR